jgi:hypothetical protein
VRIFAVLLVLAMQCCLTDASPAAQSDACKLCREDLEACVRAHSKDACKANYDICMKHCRKS